MALRDTYGYVIRSTKARFLGEAEEHEGKLYFKGTVATEAEKNQIWNAIKTIPTWERDIIADIRVSTLPTTTTSEDDIPRSIPRRATAAEHTIDLLGGARVFGGRPPDAVSMREHINKGLPFKALESVRVRLGLTATEAASVLLMPPRTLARRKEARRLASDESDRLYRLARVAGEAIDVFGSADAAAEWLRRPNRGLGGSVPIQLLDTDVGARVVELTLGRLAHGLPG